MNEHDYFEYTLNQILYALKKILVANDNNSYNLIDKITRQEIEAIKEDLKNLEGAKK